MPLLWPKATDASGEAGYPLKSRYLVVWIDFWLRYTGIYLEKNDLFMHMLVAWLPLEYWKQQIFVSQMIWGSSHWGREQSSDLWGPKEKWAHRNLTKFPKGRCKVLDPGQRNDMQMDRLGVECLETALQKKTWGSWWTRSWTSVGTVPCNKESQSCPGLC